MTDFEQLGLSYLGREIDPATRARRDVPLLYDSSDLATHGVGGVSVQLVALAWVPQR